MELLSVPTAGKLPKKISSGSLTWLKSRYEKVAVHGRNRTCFSLLYEAEPFYLATIRNTYTSDLDEIVTDVPEYHQMIREHFLENAFLP